jgi:hypothetical protein
MTDENKVDATIVSFPGPKQDPPPADLASFWICGCGSPYWRLLANGECLCTGCNCINTVISVVENRLPEAS